MIVKQLTYLAEQSKTSADLNEKFQSLFPQWTTIVATVLALIIVLLVMTKFFYKPVKKMVEDRKKFIQENIDESIRQKNDAYIDREKANQEIIDARAVASGIVANAKFEAEKIKTKALGKAKDDENRIILQAQREVARERELFAAQAKEEMVDIALAAARKIIEKNVDNTVNRKIVTEFIEEKVKEDFEAK